MERKCGECGRPYPEPEKPPPEPTGPMHKCGDCGRSFHESSMSFVYGGWVCHSCCMSDDYK